MSTSSDDPRPETVNSLKEELHQAWRIIFGLRSRDGPRLSSETAKALGMECIAPAGENQFTNMFARVEAIEKYRSQGRMVEVVRANDESVWMWDVDPVVRWEEPNKPY